MLEKIAEVTGLNYNIQDPILNAVLQRILRKLPEGTTANTPDLHDRIRAAEHQVNEEGQLAIMNLVRVLSADPAPRELKIKSSPKGARMQQPSTTGVRYSFGPVWNHSVRRGRGIAVVPANREKLNNQALTLGIDDPALMDVQSLCSRIAAELGAE